MGGLDHRLAAAVPGKRAAVASCLVALAIVVGACGSDPPEDVGGQVLGDRLTVYSSLPFQGPDASISREIVNGEKLALAHGDGRVGRWEIEYRALDDSTAAASGWEPGQVSFNARKAAQDPLTIAYIGDLGGEASAISIPILNEAGILVVGPWATNVGLTEDGAGADKGEPEKHYPNGERTYGRVIPNDGVQAEALVELMGDRGVEALYVAHDRRPYGRSLAGLVTARADENGIEVVDVTGLDANQEQFRALANEVRQSGADAMFFGGSLEDNAARLFADVRRASPAATLFGPGALARQAFASELPPGISNVLLTAPALPPERYPAPGRRFAREYARAYGEPPGPAAAYGYEAMAATLQAIADAGPDGNDRAAVIDAFHVLERPDSMLGPYAIEADGDTTLSTYAVYHVEGRRLELDRLIDVE